MSILLLLATSEQAAPEALLLCCFFRLNFDSARPNLVEYVDYIIPYDDLTLVIDYNMSTIWYLNVSPSLQLFPFLYVDINKLMLSSLQHSSRQYYVYYIASVMDLDVALE